MAITVADSYAHGIASAAGTGLYLSLNGTPTFGNSAPTVPNGGYWMRQNPSAAQIYVQYPLAATPRHIGFAMWFRVTTGSGGEVNLSRTAGSTGNRYELRLKLETGVQNLYLRSSTDGASGITDVFGFATTLDTWYCLHVDFDISANPWTGKWRYKPEGGSWTTLTQNNPAFAAQDCLNHVIGNIDTNGSWDWRVAHYVQWDTATEYDTTLVDKEQYVLGYSPDSVAAHNLDAATSTFFFKDISAAETALTTSETTSYQVIDDLPLNADTDHILLKKALGGAGGSLPVHQATVLHSGNPTTAPSTTLGTTAADDVLICVITNGGANTVPTPAGTYSGGAWTKIDDGVLSTTGDVVAYWSRCTGNHTGQTVSATTTDSGSLMVSRYNNVYAGGNPIGANKSESATTNAANPGLTAFTTTTANSKVILCGGADDNLAVVTAATAGGNAMTVRGAPTSSGGADSGVFLADRDQAAAGTSGAFATTWGANAAGTAKYLLGFELLGAATLTNPTNTWYVEYGFANSAETTDPLAVRGVVTLRNDSGTTVNSITAKLRANSNESDIFSGDIGSATNIYKTALFTTAPGGAAWTDTIFDGATLRWGYSADADSTPRLESALLEAVFAIAPAAAAEDPMPYIGGGYYA